MAFDESPEEEKLSDDCNEYSIYFIYYMDTVFVDYILVNYLWQAYQPHTTPSEKPETRNFSQDLIFS
jgi:hypothetical protein